MAFFFSINSKADEFVYTPEISNLPYDEDLQFADLNNDGSWDIVYQYFENSGHGGQFSYLLLLKGDPSSHFSTWKIFVDNNPPIHTFLISDWNHDGYQEILCRYGFHSLVLLRFDENDFVEQSAVSNLDDTINELVQVGDFDGDGNMDALARAGDQTMRVLWGLGTGYFEIENPNRSFPQLSLVADWNKDGRDDVVNVIDNQVIILYGNSMRTQSFIEQEAHLLPIVPNQLELYQNKSLLITSATEWILGNKTQLSIQFEVPIFPDTFNPLNWAIHDIDQDGKQEILSWDKNTIHAFRETGEQVFEEIFQITVPFIENLLHVQVRDMDQDGNNDLLVFADDQSSIIYYNRPNTPTSTPTPFHTQTPTQFATSTPTCVPIIPSAIRILDSTNLYEVISNAEDGSILLMDEVTHSPSIPWDDGNDQFLIENKTLNLIGLDPNHPPYFETTFEFRNSRIVLQNLIIDPFPPFITPLTINNSEADLIHLTIHGTDPSPSLYGESTYPGGPTVLIENSIHKTVRFVENEIAAGSPLLNLYVQNCKDTIIDLRANPRLGLQNAIANMEIIQCESLTVLLGDRGTIDYPSINSLTVENSTIVIEGGILHGTDGYWTIPYAKGYGLKGRNHSILYLNGTQIYAGNGGEGEIPGIPTGAIDLDDTSQIIYKSNVTDWFLY